MCIKRTRDGEGGGRGGSINASFTREVTLRLGLGGRLGLCQAQGVALHAKAPGFKLGLSCSLLGRSDPAGEFGQVSVLGQESLITYPPCTGMGGGSS